MPSPFPDSTSLLGDSLEILREFPDDCFDHAIIDPPYNMSKKKGLSWAFSKHITMNEAWDRFTEDEFFSFTLDWMQEVCRVVKEGGNLFIFGTYHNIYLTGFLLNSLERRILNSIIWAKPNAQPNITCRTLTESTEQIIWACNATPKRASKWTFHYQKAKEYNEGKQLRNHWSIPVTPRSERVASHPTQKPLKLIDRIVHLFSNEGEWILDPFAGTGTTGLAAAKRKRNFCLIEKHEPYFQGQQERFQLHHPRLRIRFEEGFSFHQDGTYPKNHTTKSSRA